MYFSRNFTTLNSDYHLLGRYEIIAKTFRIHNFKKEKEEEEEEVTQLIVNMLGLTTFQNSTPSGRPVGKDC